MNRLLTRNLALVAASILLWAQPAAAQSILRDAETEAMFAAMATPVVTAAGLGPRNVRVVLVNDDSVNAFVAGGQTVFIHTGTLQAADTLNEVQGVFAHEVGHITGGHVPLGSRMMKAPMGITILSMVLGLAAMAAGSGEAGAGIMAAGQQAAQGSYLSFSRSQEASADAAGANYLIGAGITGRGYLSFFKKMQQLEYRYGITRKIGFMLDHPVSSERIANLTDTLTTAASWSRPPDPALEEQFRRVKAKLKGYVQTPDRTLQDYPESDKSIYAHYARAYAYHKAGFPDKADAEAEALVRAEPNNPYFQEIKGQILLEAGKPQESLAPLRFATEKSGQNPLIATTFGHALIATEDKANYPEAIKVLRVAVARDDENPTAWVQLGTVYEASGDTPRAALATAERASMTGDSRTAAQSAAYALANITPNTPDWIRAQDIAMTARNDIEDNPKKYKRK